MWGPAATSFSFALKPISSPANAPIVISSICFVSSSLLCPFSFPSDNYSIKSAIKETITLPSYKNLSYVKHSQYQYYKPYFLPKESALLACFTSSATLKFIFVSIFKKQKPQDCKKFTQIKISSISWYKMKDFPSCFGETGVQIADSSSNRSAAQNVVTCTYQYESEANAGFIIVTWIKHLMGQGLTIAIETFKNECLCKIDIKPWLFSKRKGFRKLTVNSKKIDVYWDFSSAKFGSGPEPLEGFYLSVALNQELCLLLGDKKVDSNSNPSVPISTLLSKRENIFGKRLYSSKAQFCDKGQLHDIRIEHDTNDDQSLVIHIDNKMAMRVLHLKWKFRGNHTILVDGISVEVYWDVHSWLFGNVMDHAVFVFRTRVRGEKMSNDRLEPYGMGWSGLGRFKESHLQGHGGFSLVLCAWKNE